MVQTADIYSDPDRLRHLARRTASARQDTLHRIDSSAATRNIVDGQQVRVKSRVGSVQIKAEISNEVMQGVVSIPHGWGHHREDTQLTVAQAHPGASINDLTDDHFNRQCGV